METSYCSEMFRVLIETIGAGFEGTPYEVARRVVEATFAAHEVRPKLYKVLIEQLPTSGRGTVIIDFQRQLHSIVAAQLATRPDVCRPTNLTMAASIMVEAVRGIVIAIVTSFPEYQHDADLVEEVTQLVLRYSSNEI